MYSIVLQKEMHFTQFTTGSLMPTFCSIALTNPRWLAAVQENSIIAMSVNSIPYAAAVTLSVVVMATQLVTLLHGCTLVGEATDVPIASVGVAEEEQGTQMVQ